MKTPDKIKDFAVVNGTTLYYEKQGTGTAVLLIAGSTGDAGNFTRAADLLADEFAVVTYDRRGNSRSPRPTGWTATSVAEQADDAAGLIDALDLARLWRECRWLDRTGFNDQTSGGRSGGSCAGAVTLLTIA